MKKAALFLAGLLFLVSCNEGGKTAVPPSTAVQSGVPTPTLAAIEPTDTAVPTPIPPTTAPPTAVPDTADLLAGVQAGLPPNAYDDLAVFPLSVPEGERPLWVVHSVGMRHYDLDPVPGHFIAIYTVEDGGWRELARQSLDDQSDEFFASPDYLFEGGVAQVEIDPAYIWLVVEGGVGAHGGTYNLLRFDGSALHIEASASAANPGVGSLSDLNGDGMPELIIEQHDYYVFCYACGVRYLNFQVLTWDAANQRMNEIVLQPLPPSQQDNPAYPSANRAIELAQADLWSEALAQIEVASRLDAADAVIAGDAALIRLYHDAWQAEMEQTPYPLLTAVFAGEYAAALDIMRGYSNEQIFSSDTPLIQGTAAEGMDQQVANYILGETNAVIAAKPDLLAAYFLRAWATFLQNPANPQIQADLNRVKALNPSEPLFANAAVPAPNRIQFAPGATSAEISGQIGPGGIDVYVLRAQAGQGMTVDLFASDEYVDLQLLDSRGNWLEGQRTSIGWQGVLPETADYLIRVIGGESDTDYTLRVTIPSRIVFAPGAISAQVQGDVAAHENVDYILSAQAGQTMTVLITSPNNDVLLTIVGADGIPLTNGLMSGATGWTGTLPVTQDYIIRALGTFEAATYALEVTIE